MGYNLEQEMANQEANEGKVNVNAVAKAKENIANRVAEEEARKVERRLVDSEKITNSGLKELRMSRSTADAQKKYLTEITEAKEAFESSGDYDTYDATVNKSREARDNAINEAKRKIYGDEYWRY